MSSRTRSFLPVLSIVCFLFTMSTRRTLKASTEDPLQTKQRCCDDRKPLLYLQIGFIVDFLQLIEGSSLTFAVFMLCTFVFFKLYGIRSSFTISKRSSASNPRCPSNGSFRRLKMAFNTRPKPFPWSLAKTRLASQRTCRRRAWIKG